MPTQNLWAWVGMGMGMGMGTQCRALIETNCVPRPSLYHAKVTPTSGQKIPIDSNETQLKHINNKLGGASFFYRTLHGRCL